MIGALKRCWSSLPMEGRFAGELFNIYDNIYLVESLTFLVRYYSSAFLPTFEMLSLARA